MPPHTPKPDLSISQHRKILPAVGTTQAVGSAAISPTPQHPGIPIRRPVGVDSARISRPIRVPTPLSHVSPHVIQAIIIGGKGTHRTRVWIPANLPHGIFAGWA